MTVQYFSGEVRGLRGPGGQSSGPLGVASVGADEIKGDTSDLQAIREKLEVPSANEFDALQASLLRPEWARVLKKLRDNAQQVTIACQGDSNTYAQSGDGSTGPRGPINGSTSRRLTNDWPGTLSLSTNLIWPAISGTPAVSITNQGFPGDTVVSSYARWEASAVFDVRLIMLGTNDSSSLSVEDFVAGYRVIIEWAIGRGEAVALILPPNGAGVGNQAYRAYANAARDLANEYSLPFLDAEETLRQFRGMAVVGADLLHFTEEAQQQLGWDATTLLMPWGATNCLRVGPGTRIDGTDFASPSGNYDLQANSRSGRVVNLDPGKVFAIAVDCATDVLPILEMTNQFADYQTVLTKFDGGRQVGIAVSRGTNYQPFGSYRNAQALPILRKGRRLVLVHNQTAGNVQIDAVRFETPRSAFDMHNWQVLPDMQGTGPIKVGITEARSFLRSNLRYRTRALRSLVKLGATTVQGIAMFETHDAWLDYGDPDQLALLRNGADLMFRRFVDGTLTQTVLSSTAFGSDASNPVTCELAIGFDGTNAIAYLNGAPVGSPLPYTNRSGYPAWMVEGQDLAFECRSMHVLEAY